MNSQYLALFATIILDSGLQQSELRAQANLLVPSSTSENMLSQCSQRNLFIQVASLVQPPPDRGAPDGRTDGASRNN